MAIRRSQKRVGEGDHLLMPCLDDLSRSFLSTCPLVIRDAQFQLRPAKLLMVDNPATNPTDASEIRFAVAIHEAGHAIAFGVVGIDVLSVWIGSGSNPSGHTQSGEIVAAGRPDFLATLYAGDIAVEELCGGR